MKPGFPSVATAWQVHATPIPNLNAKEYRSQLIHETPSIRRFLDDARGERYIISAPKGFGKTLLLIAKSAQLHEADGGLATGSGGQIIDRPSGVFPNFSQSRIHEIKGDYQFWKNLWKISIMSAAVKISRMRHHDPILKGQIGCDDLLEKAMLNPELYRSPASFFTYLVEMSADQQMKVVRKSGQLGAYFAQIRSQIAFSIDNVDEYFKPALEDMSVGADIMEGEYYQSRSNELWTLAQIALAGAAYELTQANSHLKIFCTVRREAFLQLDRYDDQVQQIQGATLSIEYGEADYEQIFNKNIDLMLKDDLVDKDASTAIERFIGPENVSLNHRIVSKDENAFKHILRHTVFRPRDLMHVGVALSSIVPARRADDVHFKNAVSSSSKNIIKALITEMRPFFPIPELSILLSLIQTNALSMAEMNKLSTEYLIKRGVSVQSDGLDDHPFCVLYRIGLLGCIKRDLTSAEAIQSFLKPYEIKFDHGNGLPPTEEFYLIHPALDQTILDISGHRYITNFHSQNIVGDALTWREPLDSFFVLKGDVCKFSEIMTTEIYPALASRLHAWAKSAAETLHYFDVFGGDSVIFIDRSATKLLRAASQFLRSASDYRERGIKLRFGGSAGPITFQRLDGLYAGNWQQIEVPLGLALRQSSRLEPIAPEGEILVDDEFRRRAGEISEFVFEAPQHSIPLEQDSDGRFLVRKGLADAAVPSRLWVVKAKLEGAEGP